MKISVISLIAYDAAMLVDSIKSYYQYVDEIILGVDESRISWSGNTFTFEEDKLWSELKAIDLYNKIELVEGNFHQSTVPLENDNYERNFLKSQCTHDWVMSFDADEVLVNAKQFFIDYLPLAYPYYKKVDLLFTWFHPFKKFENETLMVANNDGSFCKSDQQGFATHKERTFTYCRWTDNQDRLLTPLAIMHYSFCRSQEEFNQKLDNYGHSPQRHQDPFFHNWQVCNLDNFEQLRNFKSSGMGTNQWERLVKVPNDSLWKVAEQQAQLII